MSPEELASIRERSVNGSADWDDPVSDARTLLDERDRLADELTAERAKVERANEILDDNAPPDHVLKMNGRWAELPWDELRAALDGAE